MLRCGPRWVMIFSSDISACFSLERAVAERRRGESAFRTLQTRRSKDASRVSDDLVW